jgi:tRNA 2-thiouridine synthesizing protein A
MSQNLQVDQRLDCTGLACPLPVIKTKQTIDKMTVGQVLEMISTDPGSTPDMQAWSRKTGHELLEAKHEGNLYIFYIRKTK